MASDFTSFSTLPVTHGPGGRQEDIREFISRMRDEDVDLKSLGYASG